MALQRMDNVLIVVDDLEAAKAFFAELGMELNGETTVEGPWVDSVVGLNDVRADSTMMRTPDGHGRVRLTEVPHAAGGQIPAGKRDIDDVLGRAAQPRCRTRPRDPAV